MRLAITTSSDYADGYKDTAELLKIFRKMGVESSLEIWDDPEVNWKKFDGILLHTTWDYTDKYEVFLKWCKHVAESSRLINDYRVVQANSTKHYLLELQEKGVAIPYGIVVAAGQTVELSNLQLQFKGSVVVKPFIDASGKRARLFRSVTEAYSYIDALSGSDVFVQEFVDDILNHGEQSAIIINGKLSHVIRKIPASNEFRVQEEHGGTTVAGEILSGIEGYCLEILDKLGCYPVYARIDFIDSTTRLLMEVEMIEPDLFLRYSLKSYILFCEAIVKAVSAI